MPSKALLSFDTDSIQKYVFETGTLKDIRGASALLDELNRMETPSLLRREAAPEAETIYAHGGSGLFLLDADHVNQAIAAVQKLYKDKTSAAGISGASVETPLDFDLDSPAAALFKLLSLRLRCVKDSNPEYIDVVSSPYFKICESCGIRYSQNYAAAGGEGGMCRACRQKKEKDEQVKRTIKEYFSGERAGLSEDRAPLWEKLFFRLRDGGYDVDGRVERPESFGVLGGMSEPDNYLGLIVADGDGMGKVLGALNTMAEFREFADRIDRAIIDTMAEVIIRHLQLPPNSESSRRLPFDVLLQGGDDLVMVTRAQSAIDVAIDLVKGFSGKASLPGSEPLKMSACVVIAHAKFPFQAMYELAESGLRFAKEEAHRRRMRKNRTASTGLINFLAISSPSALSFQDHFKANLTGRLPGQNRDIYRTMRPYEPDQLRKLVDVARGLAGAPRSRLRQLYEACHLDYYNSLLSGMKTLARWGRSEQADLIRSLYNAPHTVNCFPWLKTEPDGDLVTPLVDLVELYDFVKRGTA